MNLDDKLLTLAAVALNAWAGGEIDGSDFLEEPEVLVHIVKLATDNQALLEELVLEGGLERLVADWLQRKGAVT